MRQEIRSLTGLRGVAACYVMLYHYCRPASTGLLLKHGYLAVDLFFVLSGFVIALTYADTFHAGIRWPAYRDFLYKRLSRIYPLYLIMTLATMAAAMVGGKPITITAKDWLANMLLISGWGVAPTIAAAAWSISVELAAYLLFPVLVLATLRPGRWGAIGIAGALGLLAAWLAGRSDLAANQLAAAGFSRSGPLDLYSAGTALPLLRCLLEFTGGMLAYRLAVSGWLVRHGGRWLTDGMALLALVLLALPGTDVAEAGLDALLVAGLYAGGSATSRLLACRPAHWLGVISYSLYLVHIPLQHKLQPRLVGLFAWHGFLIGTVLTMVVTLLAATLAYRLIERPARRWLLQLAAAP